MKSIYRKNHKIIFILFILIAVITFIFIVFMHESKLKEEVSDTIKKHANVIKTSLWTYEKNAHVSYLELAMKSNNYDELTVFDDMGKVFIQLKSEKPSFLKNF